MSNIDNSKNQGRNQTRQSSGFEGMAEQHQEMGGSPGSVRAMASKAGERIMDTAERQKAVGADYVDTIAGAVRRAAGEFEGQVPQAAHYIRYAADQMETMSDSFRRRDIAQMMQDVQSFARRQPTAFLGLGFLAGFAAVRFLKSGAPGSGPSSSSGGSWREREPLDTGRYGAATRSGFESGFEEDRFGDNRSPGMSPGLTPGAGL